MPELPKIPDNENFAAWLAKLDKNDLPQTKDTLVSEVYVGDDYDWDGLDIERDPSDYQQSFCCLGVACKVAPEELGLKYLDGTNDLLPAEVADWYGLGPYWDPHNDRSRSWDAVLADSEQLDIELDAPHSLILGGGPSTSFMTTAWLNDQKFTFPQIADMIRYFGIRRLTS